MSIVGIFCVLFGLLAMGCLVFDIIIVALHATTNSAKKEDRYTLVGIWCSAIGLISLVLLVVCGAIGIISSLSVSI